MPSPGGTEIPWEMDQEYIDELVEDYGRSAANMQKAGIDGVEVHAAHGYLPMQFLSPAFNKRTDRYGGSPRRNAQLLVEIGESIRSQVGGDYTVGMRFSFDEYIGDAGVTPELAEEYLDIFAATGFFDFFSISSGSYHSFHYAVPAMGSLPQAFLVDYGRRAKQVVGDRAKIFLAGRILDLATAERVVSSGAADMVAMVRAHMADPFLIAKTLEGRESEVVRCVGANECLATGFRGRRMHCVMNPAVGREQRWGEGTLRPAPEPKQVAVVGAGPAGLQVSPAWQPAAGHEVTLFEERDGGRRAPGSAQATTHAGRLAEDDRQPHDRRRGLNGVDVRVGVRGGCRRVVGGGRVRRGRLCHRLGVGSPAGCPGVVPIVSRHSRCRCGAERPGRRNRGRVGRSTDPAGAGPRRWSCWTTAAPTSHSGWRRSWAARGSRWRSSAGSLSSASTWWRRWNSRGCCRAWPTPG